MKHQIRLGRTDSVKSTNKNNSVSVPLFSTSRKIAHTDIKDTIDQYEVFQEEREQSDKYRLILTVNPYCTNALFNSITEMYQYNDQGALVDAIVNNNKLTGGIDGTATVLRTQYISNTMYSNKDNGNWEYHPGYDIFDNHILRNTEFKIVEDTPNRKGTYNTLADVVRSNDGNKVSFYKRINGVETKPKEVVKHLYDYDNLLSYVDSVNSNLTEDNGWMGFINVANLETYNTKGDKESKVNCVLNNRKENEFIDLYPGRDLYSFTPKYNKYFKEDEYNWDILLTYPYENDYTNELVYTEYIGDETESKPKTHTLNGLKVHSYKFGNDYSGKKIMIFKTYTKHNLAFGDYIRLRGIYIYSENPGEPDNEEATEVTAQEAAKKCSKRLFFDEVYRIRNIGDMTNGDEEYYFYIDDITEEINNALYEIGNSYEINSDPKDDSLNFEWRINKIKGDVMSKYYVRKFRQIPKITDETVKPTEDDTLTRESYNKYLNLKSNNVKWEHKCEVYRLGFSSTIYNDDATQFTFTDTIDLGNLRDNLARPVSEIYVTILKTNRGKEVYEKMLVSDETFKELYKNKASLTDDDETTIKEIYDNHEFEQSHCFGKLIDGFLFDENNTDDDCSNVRKLTYQDGTPITPLEKEATKMRRKKTLTLDVDEEETEEGEENEENTVDDQLHTDTDTVEDDNTIDGNDNSHDQENAREEETEETEEEVAPPKITIKDAYYIPVDETNNYPTMKNIEKDLIYDTYIDEEDDKEKLTFDGYNGDVVEFSPTEYREYILADVNYRFNTIQREPCISNNGVDETLYYHEIKYDDYDTADFTIRRTGTGFEPRKEGYYYKPHYRIPIKQWGDLQQMFHENIVVDEIKAVQHGGILLAIKTKTINNVYEGDIILLSGDDLEEDVTKFICVARQSKIRFMIKPIDGWKDGLRWNDVIYKIANDESSLLRQNEDIPESARRTGRNSYVFRPLKTIEGNGTDNTDGYVFANGVHYLTPVINFYLRRQDPHDNMGLYAGGRMNGGIFPNDISGNILKPSNYVYNETSKSIC